MKKIAMLSVLMLLVCSCYKEPCTHLSQISIKTNIVASNGKSVTTTAGSSSFTTSDSIGVIGSYNYSGAAVKWVYNATSTQWSTSTPMYWIDKTSPHIFYAYSPYTPYNPLTSTLVNMPALAVQEGTNDLFKYDFLHDFLIGTYSTVSTDGTLVFNLLHTSSLLVLNIKSDATSEGGTYNSFALTNAGIATTSRFDFNASVGYQVVYNATAVDTVNVNQSATNTLSATPTTFFVVVNPKTSLNTEFVISYQIAGVTYTSKGVLPDDFSSGKMYSYNITVTLNDINISAVSITDWEPGSVSSPNIPTS